MDDRTQAHHDLGTDTLVEHGFGASELVFENKPNVQDYEMDLWEVICVSTPAA
jgi:hypothetical protein